MDRRTLLQWMVATGGATALHRFSTSDLERLGEDAHRQLSVGGDRQPRRALTPDEYAVAVAAAECILPRTSTAGATDARVADFIDVMLADWYPATDARRLRQGLASLDEASRAQFGSTFAAATGQQQVQLVQRLDDEVAALRATSAAQANAHWFGMLKYLTVWGFCTSEAGMREVLRTHPRPNRYDGNAPVR